MHTQYLDIMSRIKENPIWFDEHAVPRFDDFHPTALANIYAKQCALALVACQICNRKFRVALSCTAVTPSPTAPGRPMGRKIDELIQTRKISYGDPPNVGCCPGGPSSTSDMIEILEFWRRDFDTGNSWGRDESLEGPI
jgi:hypothetical protein